MNETFFRCHVAKVHHKNRRECLLSKWNRVWTGVARPQLECFSLIPSVWLLRCHRCVLTQPVLQQRICSTIWPSPEQPTPACPVPSSRLLQVLCPAHTTRVCTWQLAAEFALIGLYWFTGLITLSVAYYFFVYSLMNDIHIKLNTYWRCSLPHATYKVTSSVAWFFSVNYKQCLCRKWLFCCWSDESIINYPTENILLSSIVLWVLWLICSYL